MSVLELTHHLLRLNEQRLLVSRIEERLRSLEEMQAPLQAEVEQNAAHGEALELLVREHCLPVELERYKLFVGDLERVVNLLLCLSARLARVQNALSTVDQHTDAEEKVRNASACLLRFCLQLKFVFLPFISAHHRVPLCYSLSDAD